jgi:membrane-associated protease RseP (regulator of RpoE activity)
MTAAALALATPVFSQESECPGGRRPAGDLGIQELRCSSGRCLRGFVFEDGRLTQTFTTEPRVHDLEPPADAVLEVGDILVSVDGSLSTTSDAARRLAQVEAGDRVRLRIRRDGVEKDVTITAAATCDPVHRRVFALDPEAVRRWGDAMERLGENLEFRFDGLEALEGLDWEELGRDLELHVLPDVENLDFDFQFDFDTLGSGLLARVEPPYELGLELTCGFFCGWRRGEGDAVVWRGQHPPKVAGVIEGGPADRAGIREGDVLLLLDGHSFVGQAGGRAIGRLRPGQSLTLQYLRGGETLTTTTITPRAPRAR